MHTYIHICIHGHTQLNAGAFSLYVGGGGINRAFMHTYINTYIHTHIHTYIHTYTHTHTHTAECGCF